VAILMVSRLDCHTWDTAWDFVEILRSRGYTESIPEAVECRTPLTYAVREHGRGATISYTEPKIEMIAARRTECQR
jgi:hypothetical protein